MQGAWGAAPEGEPQIWWRSAQESLRQKSGWRKRQHLVGFREEGGESFIRDIDVHVYIYIYQFIYPYIYIFSYAYIFLILGVP